MADKYSYKDITLNAESFTSFPKSELKTLDLGHLFVFVVEDGKVTGSAIEASFNYTGDALYVNFTEAKTGTFRIIRSTPYDALWHDFNNGAKFTDTNVEEVWLQLLYLYQEILEGKYVPET